MDKHKIAVFVDGTFFARVSDYYYHSSPYNARMSFSGLIDVLCKRLGSAVAAAHGYSQGTDPACNETRLIETHYFRGIPMSGSFVAPDSTEQISQQQINLLRRRSFENLLTGLGVHQHYLPLVRDHQAPAAEAAPSYIEKGVDIWFAVEVLDCCLRPRHRAPDTVILITGDSDFMPLVRKVHSLGIDTLVPVWNLTSNVGVTRTSNLLANTVTYAIDMDRLVPDVSSEADNPDAAKLIKTLFVQRTQATDSTTVEVVDPKAQAVVDKANAQNGPEDAQLVLGAVAALPDSREYGFIQIPGEAERRFFHMTWMSDEDYAGSFEVLTVGDMVSCKLATNPKDNRPIVKDITVIRDRSE